MEEGDPTYRRFTAVEKLVQAPQFVTVTTATMSRDGVIRVWSLAEPSAPKCIKVLKDIEQGDYTISAFVAFDKQSKTLISQAMGKNPAVRVNGRTLAWK